ncbi:hypothetical protein TBLA_0B06150 [Henningerozyma blattae CBS 6284]|uniref:FAM86 N-terminal domain-containing protein n=1 Tax=Henningerozyma blattae (strain ATCC 34711 / CBS 6284 / DSM 70876 / NBRC 10599 / NRRL Y-10934 / UCD 77-7) TaxID=1071380 RepID=I2GZ89_HENB6|nr:hypothetical protein TBLA_0B06150 [Tetrapisispora blattae CBS 6284]CCH59441.1 hypothetical protein TBLA_0B06150 [Tetrapisispora blattae CBS 6284]
MSDEFYYQLHHRCDLNLLELDNELLENLKFPQINDEFGIIYRRNPYYYKKVIKILIDQMEKCDTIDEEIGEWLYEEYVKLISEDTKVKQALNPTFKDIVRYEFGNERLKIEMEETPNVISGNGTTGLRTWEAALYMILYLLEHPVRGNVVEIGAGTGMVSIGIMKMQGQNISSVLVTDGDEYVANKQLPKNFQLNGIVDDTRVKFQKIRWNEDHLVNGDGPNVDYLVGADVTYDVSVLDDLVCCIEEIMAEGVRECLISATRRNPETLLEFERLLVANGLQWEVVSDSTMDCPELQALLNRPMIGPILIYSITKQE